MCPYCEQFIPSRFSEHLANEHAEKKEVFVFILMDLDDPNRRKVVSYILHLGYSVMNKKLKTNHPVSKQRSKDVLKKNCIHCGASYSKDSLRKHAKSCQGTVQLIEDLYQLFQQ